MNKKIDQPTEEVTSNEPAPEHHAVLDAIANEAGAIEVQAVEIDPAEAQSKAQNWAEIPAMLGSLLSILEPSLANVYTQEACLNWGACMVPVAEKYGWGDAPLGCEVPLAIATIGLAAPTYALVTARLAAMKAAQPAPKAQPQAQAQSEGKPAESQEPATGESGFPPENFWAMKHLKP